MATNTTNYSLVKPTVGETGWGDSLNDNFDTIDDLIKTEEDAIALKAPIASPTFTGTPAAPTAATGTNTTQLATTAFVNSQITAVLAAGIGLSKVTADTNLDMKNNKIYNTKKIRYTVSDTVIAQDLTTHTPPNSRANIFIYLPEYIDKGSYIRLKFIAKKNDANAESVFGVYSSDRVSHPLSGLTTTYQTFSLDLYVNPYNTTGLDMMDMFMINIKVGPSETTGSVSGIYLCGTPMTYENYIPSAHF